MQQSLIPRFGFLLGVSSVLACGPFATPEVKTSSPLVTDVAHTISKRQSIGNCWLYASASWLESIVLSHQNETLDVSESYWTWWYFYQQLLDLNDSDEITTGGSWSTARSLILRYGFVSEGDFIADEAGTEMSLRQRQAESYIRDQLAFGELKDANARTPEKVRQVLDEAFGSNMAVTEKLAQPAASKLIRFQPNGQMVTLRELLDRRSTEACVEVPFPKVFGEHTEVNASKLRARRQLWKRVFRALNDRQPVVISLMIDFNALDNKDGTFKGDRLRELGSGDQGGHLTVLEDYTVIDVPGVGSIGRGEVSEELQEQALIGTLDRLVVKNSWGVNRPERGIQDGITLFDRSYLEDQFAWKSDEEASDSPVQWYTTLAGFVLPAGY
jgi:hypothetical protein